MPDGKLKIFRLVPDAPDTDPRWDIAEPVGEVVVRAESPADARIVASHAEPDFPEVGAAPGDGVETDFASAVRDERLYRVEEDTSGRYPTEGEREVLQGGPDRKATIRPLQE